MPDRDIIIIKKEKDEEKKQFSTPYTLVDLEYDAEDIAECLKTLTAEEYSETKIDKDDDNPPLLFVFGKKLNGNFHICIPNVKWHMSKRVYAKLGRKR